jgi:microsomal dipeptidase-like Zn-dependent dipeptidase
MGASGAEDVGAPIADLHCHYPMHVLARTPAVEKHLSRRVRRNKRRKNLTLEHAMRVRGHPGFWPKFRALVILIAARLKNFRSYHDTWRVDLPKLRRGRVQFVCSVLYLPFAELFDGHKEDGDYDQLLDLISDVEADVLDHPEESPPVIVTTEADLDRAIDERRIALMHCIEGAFHLGRHEAEIPERIRELSNLGVAYITLAHLFYRGVATNSAALPMFTDRQYDKLFPQPEGGALSPLGELVVRAMYEQRILIDVSHMREDALTETFELLKHLDRTNGGRPTDYPVLATHAGYRFGDQAYMLTADTIREIAAREGVIGLIMSQHQLNNGLGVDDAESSERTLRTIRSHIDAIRDVTGSHAYVGIGSDLDGFIKPTVAGIDDVDDLANLRAPLMRTYPDDVDAILHGNALRALRKAYAGRPVSTT